METDSGSILKQLIRQLEGFFILPKSEIDFLQEQLASALSKLEQNLKCTINRYNWKDAEVYFSPYNSMQYLSFLYEFSRLARTENRSALADKLYYLNKIMNGIDIYHSVDLCLGYHFDHPLGTVLGRATYSNYFKAIQGCTVGNNMGIYPKIGECVSMLAHSSIIGNCTIGSNVLVGANTVIKDEDIPDNSVVLGHSPHLKILPLTTEVKDMYLHWNKIL